MSTGAGELKFRVALIKKQDNVLNSEGGTSVEYKVIENRWCDLSPITRRKGHKVLSTRNLSDDSTHDILIRYEERFEHRGLIDHAVIKGKMYEVNSVVTEGEDDLFLILESVFLGKPSSEYNVIELP